jgi:sugar phosphate isomerase/epimerase
MRVHVNSDFSRRDLLLGGTGLTVSGSIGETGKAAEQGAPARAAAGQPAAPRKQTGPLESHFRFGLNTSTIRGQKRPITEEIAIAQQAGYAALEPWIDELERYEAEGGSLEELGKRLRDAQITVESAIGFFDWVVDDRDRRRRGFESARRAMDLVRRIGGKRLAAPPSGATEAPVTNLLAIAERYRALLELGDTMDVVPQVEVWGGSKTLSRLGEAAYVAIASEHPKACILTDVYHLYRGGSGFAGINLLAGRSIHVFHFNDYPADPPREKLTDAHRVYPGDGVAPLKPLLRDLAAGGYQVTLSLELFNRTYWTQDPLSVARKGLEKMKALFV